MIQSAGARVDALTRLQHSIQEDKHGPFYYKSFREGDSLWGALLEACFGLIDYQQSVSDTEENQLLDALLASLLALWNEAMSFREKAKQTALLACVDAWVQSDCHGDTEAYLKVMECLYLVTYALHHHIHPSSFTTRLLPTTMFEQLIAKRSLIVDKHQAICEQSPRFQATVITHRNAPDLLKAECASVARLLETKKNDYERLAVRLTQCLPLLATLSALLNSSSKDIGKQLFQLLANDDDLNRYLDALGIPDTERNAWIITRESYLKGGVTNHARYYTSGIHISQQSLAALIDSRLQILCHQLEMSTEGLEPCRFGPSVAQVQSMVEGKQYLAFYAPSLHALSTLVTLAEQLSYPETTAPTKKMHGAQFLSLFVQRFSAAKLSTQGDKIIHELRAQLATVEAESMPFKLWAATVCQSLKIVESDLLSPFNTTEMKAIIIAAIRNAYQVVLDVSPAEELPVEELLHDMSDHYLNTCKALLANITCLEQILSLEKGIGLMQLKLMALYLACDVGEELQQYSVLILQFKWAVWQSLEDSLRGETIDLAVYKRSFQQLMRRQPEAFRVAEINQRLLFFADKITRQGLEPEPSRDKQSQP